MANRVRRRWSVLPLTLGLVVLFATGCEPLKNAPSDVQQRWTEWRESWNRFLATLPATVPSGS